MTRIFEPKPRWLGAPPYCIEADRMAFKNLAELNAYRASIGMSSYSPRKVWVCHVCGHWHYDGRVPNPSGDSSGTGRDSK